MTGGIQRALSAVGAVALATVGLVVMCVVLMPRDAFSTRVAPSRLETILAQTMRRLALTEHRQTLRAPHVTEAALVEAQLHWASHCANCHAPDGSGETMLGKNLYPPAPDLRSEVSQQLSDGEIYSAINNGIRLTGMPAWGEQGDDDSETWALVAFIRTLPTLSDATRSTIIENLPRTPQEETENREEDDFLRGATPSPRQHEEHQ